MIIFASPSSHHNGATAPYIVRRSSQAVPALLSEVSLDRHQGDAMLAQRLPGLFKVFRVARLLD